MCVLFGSNPIHLIILFSCLFLLHAIHVHAQYPNGILREVCSTSANYTSNSQFQTNLNLLLRSLLSNGTQDRFFNTSVGANPDIVYGLVQCRPDVSMEDCRSCLNTSSVEILQRCPKGKGAALRYNFCILRYSNLQFFSQIDDNPILLVNTREVSEAYADRYSQQLKSLMNNLSNTAASRTSRYASGSAGYTTFGDIYALVECTRDLSNTSCFACLQKLIGFVEDYTRRQGAQIAALSCNIGFELSSFFTSEPPPPPIVPPPPPIDAPPPESTTGNMKGKSTNVVAIVAPIVASVFLLAICGFFISRRIQKRKPEIIYDQDDIRSEESLLFDLNMIRTATNDFSDANKLGEGGFGSVYRGEFLDGQEIAVKRLSKNSGQGLQEFKNEVVLLHKLQHRNLVRLLGFCLSGEEKLLIYEFVSNRSLDKYIFDPTRKASLDWKKRYKIIEGIGRGLVYLHEDSRLRIIHRDLKAGNILLDKEMNAKVADFGMAKLFGVDQTQGNTNRIAGTYGYMAPEYALHGLFSVKSDVFSFGVLLLEIVSGKKNNNFHLSDTSRDLLSYAWKLWREGNALQLLDPTLMDNFFANEVMRCIHIGLLCVQDHLDDRPTMSSVLLMLNSYSITLNPPLAPAFILKTRTGAYNSAKNLKVNDLTCSSQLHSMAESLNENPR